MNTSRHRDRIRKARQQARADYIGKLAKETPNTITKPQAFRFIVFGGNLQAILNEPVRRQEHPEYRKARGRNIEMYNRARAYAKKVFARRHRKALAA